MNYILTNGCFDLFHAGHRHFLQQLKTMFPNAKVVAFVNTDESVARLKGPDRPIDPLEVRLANVRTMGVEAIRFPSNTAVPAMAEFLLHRTVIAYAKDAATGLDGPEAAWALQCNIPVLSLPRLPGISTTQIIERIRSGKGAVSGS